MDIVAGDPGNDGWRPEAMVRRLIDWQLTRFERKLGGSLDYVRFVVRTSLGAFLRLTKLLAFSNCRRAAPVDAFHTACLVASHAENCGTCLQIGVNMAIQDGMCADHVRAVIEGRPGDLPDDLAEVYAFADGVLGRRPDLDTLREQVRGRLGDRGIVELAFGIAAARSFPTIKWALGYATSCTRVEVPIR
jgi:alkylhydroperoxidase family enzyme